MISDLDMDLTKQAANVLPMSKVHRMEDQAGVKDHIWVAYHIGQHAGCIMVFPSKDGWKAYAAGRWENIDVASPTSLKTFEDVLKSLADHEMKTRLLHK